MTENKERQKEQKNAFWYDVKLISESHAGLTVNIAGFSLAMLLILPIFSEGSHTDFLREPKMINALLFFFTSLFFGILASIMYSVASGDNRSEISRVISFIGPSIAFGGSVPLLLLGFSYVLAAYLGEMYTVVRVIRVFIIFTLWLSGFLIINTIDETLEFIQQKSFNRKKWYLNKNLIFTLFILSSIPAWLRVFQIRTFEPTTEFSERYFITLLVLALMSLAYNMLYSYKEVDSNEFRKASSIAIVMKLAFIVFVGFTLFVYV